MIHPLDCKGVTTRLALGDLKHYGWRDRLMIRFHLLICWVCRKYERQLRVIGSAFQKTAKRESTSHISPDFKERLIHHLTQF